jgi:hypothetical protein
MAVTQEQIYKMAGAGSTGLVCSVIRRKGVADLFDIFSAAGIGALGLLASGSLRGAMADFALGAMDGAVAYIGSRIPEMMGGQATSAPYYPVRVSVPSPAPVAEIGSGSSVVEI